MNITNQPMQY
uniref:Uncharacterized protein n=1 Tax=Anguilla anguilla TaxID=7936 RepID=A0A0E9XY35_ANGAN